VQVDHIIPVIDPATGFTTWDAFIERLFCDRDNLQVLCTSCHDIKTKEEIKQELRKEFEEGLISAEALPARIQKEMQSLKNAEQKRRFELEKDEYKAELRRLIEEGEMTPDEMATEIPKYIKFQQERDPEQFESDSDASFIDKVKVYAEAVGTDPVTAFNRIFTGQVIRRTDNGAIIVERMSYEDSQQVKKDRGGNNQTFKLDHTIPLQLGGSNSEKNLVLVPTEEWERNTPVENYLGEALREERVSKKDAQEYIQAFKDGTMTFEEIQKKVP